MKRYKITVQDQDSGSIIFNVSCVRIDKNYNIYTDLSIDDEDAEIKKDILTFNDLEQAQNALKLVRQDLKAQNGYKTEIVELITLKDLHDKHFREFLKLEKWLYFISGAFKEKHLYTYAEDNNLYFTKDGEVIAIQK